MVVPTPQDAEMLHVYNTAIPKPAIKSSSSADTFTLWHLALKHYVTNVFYITEINIPPVMKTGSANLIFSSSLSQLPLSNICLFTVLLTADVGVFF